ncbi:MAG: lipid-binding SYLF domain-containing protein [Rhodospirillales bacterium]|nr:lipid-binding SYLF domain-containing protein [Rhodospirillales bacterium]
MVARLLAIFGVVMVMGFSEAKAEEPSETQELVDLAKFAVNNVLSEPNFSSALKLMKDAQGLLIVPRMLKAGFVIGGEGGNGVLLVKGANSEWSYPAFYTLAAGSVGLQIGVKDSQVLFIIRSRKAVDAILKDQFKLGGEVSVTAGTLGGGLSGSTTSSMGADIVSYALARGAFGGGSFEGAVIGKRTDFNKAFYGKEVSPAEILFHNTVSNPKADDLRAAIAKYN